MVISPFVGSEALASRALKRHQLRSQFAPLYPDVYLAKGMAPTLKTRALGAFLWSGRRGVVSGLAASALHGAKWVDDDTPIELIYSNPRPPVGIVTRRVMLLPTEHESGVLPFTTAARTAFDLGTRGKGLIPTVARLDALFRASKIDVGDVEKLMAQHPGSPGLRKLEDALKLVDAGAQSPRETRLRLLLINAGFPIPVTQLPVLIDGVPVAYLDMGWDDWKVGVEYDGDQHRTSRAQYVKDIKRIELLERLGWIIVRVVAEDHPAAIIRRVHEAIDRRSIVH